MFPGPARVVRLATHAMGTRFEFVLTGTVGAERGERAEAVLLRAAGEQAIELIQEAHRRLSRFEPGGVVHEINAAAGVRAVVVDDEILELLGRCAGYEVASGGAFRAVWNDRAPRPGEPPGRLLIDPSRRAVMLEPAGARLDLGGVAKGFAIDLAVRSLRESGVGSGLVHGGSSTVAALGARPSPDGGSGGPWVVGLDKEQTDGSDAVVHLQDAALSISSQRGPRPDHVVDPRSGEAAGVSGWAACVDASAEVTDAWSTALVVLGCHPAMMPESATSILPAPPGKKCTTLSVQEWAARGPHAALVRPRSSSFPQVPPPENRP